MKSDLDIAQSANLLHIDQIAEQMGLDPNAIWSTTVST